MESINHSSRPEDSVVHLRGTLLSKNHFPSDGKKMFTLAELTDLSDKINKTPIPVCVGLSEDGTNPYGFTSESKLVENELIVDATICHGVVKQLITMNMIFMTLKTSIINGKIIPEFIALNPIYTYNSNENHKPVILIK